MIKKVIFENFKLFNTEQEFEIKPLTILIGKNSSGKSALAKLPTLLSNSIMGKSLQPFSWINDKVSLGSSISDINYGKESTGLFKFKLENKEGEFFLIEILFGKNDLLIQKWNYNDVFILDYDITSKKYKLNEKDLHECVFEGFTLKRLAGSDLDIPKLDSFTFDYDYVCSYRIQPGHISEEQPQEKSIKKIGIDGKYAYEILINEYLKGSSVLIENVSNWYKKTFDGWGINLDVDLTRSKYYFELIRDKPSVFRTSLDTVGQGISQTLPLITKSFLQEENPTITIIEEPELHLHPAAHGDLAERFADSLLDCNKKYIIETHSENFILRLRRLIAEKKYEHFRKEDLKIYYIDYDPENNLSTINEILVDENGVAENWPANIFNESLDELIAIKNAQKR